MQIKECIDIVDSTYPNGYSIETKLGWLSFLDGTLINDVLKTHEGYDGRYDYFDGYSSEKLSAVLVAPYPYDRLYPAYLKMQIDNANNETDRYNDSAAIYNSYLSEYKKHYNKTHMPLTNGHRNSCRGTVKVDVELNESQYEALKGDVYAKLSEDVGEVISHDKLYGIVTEYTQNNVDMFKGKDGKTPQKGVDYFTDQEIREIETNAKGEPGKDGVSPTFAISPIEGGHTVTIHGENQSESFNVMDGVTPEMPTKLSQFDNDVGFLINTPEEQGYDIQLKTGKNGRIGLFADGGTGAFLDLNEIGAYLGSEKENSVLELVGSIMQFVGNELNFAFDSPITGLKVEFPTEETSAANKEYVDKALPQKLSQLENDSGFITPSDISAVFEFSDYGNFYTGMAGSYADVTHWYKGMIVRINRSAIPLLYVHGRNNGQGNIPATEEECIEILEESGSLMGNNITLRKYSEILGGDFGDVEKALDSIIALENSMMGGEIS